VETGDTLSSNYVEGNQWSFDNVIIPGATGQSIAVEKPGIYSVDVTTRGCTTSATHEFYRYRAETNEFVITVFPNPVTDVAEIEISEGFRNPR